MLLYPIFRFISTNRGSKKISPEKGTVLVTKSGQCSKGMGNRTIRLNAGLTAFHKEVFSDLNGIHGALLRTNRSIQAEGTFGTIK